MTSLNQPARVVTELPAYRAAVAELPVSSILAQGKSGSIVVLDGSGQWWRGALDAHAEGAAGVIIADPHVVPPEAQEILEPLAGIPVIVERPRLRPDLVAAAVSGRAGVPARVITVECTAAASELDSVLRDGVGWARALAGGPFEVRSGMAAANARFALLEALDGRTVPAVTVMGNILAAHHAGGLVQVLALGETRSEVLLDQPAGLARIETSTDAGTLGAPAAYESSPRLALRRAMAGPSFTDALTDLENLLADAALVRAMYDV